MIISHKLKCIFIAIPKTGTHAIRFALRQHLDDTDEEQVGLFVKKSYSDPEIAKHGHGHISCQQLKGSLGDEIWNSYFKFAIVRNPYDRFVSYCSFMFRKNGHFHKDPQAHMYNVLLNRKNKRHILFQPQYSFICDDQNRIMIDYVGHYENLQAEYDTIAKKIGIDPEELDRINGSKHAPYDSYYNGELQHMVVEQFKEDFEIFEYSKQLKMDKLSF